MVQLLGCLALFALSLLSKVTVKGLSSLPKGVKPGMLNVHLVAHSHDDVGWKKTVDQYYDGTHNGDLQPSGILTASVSNTIDSVIRSLNDDPSRKFSFAEQAFFQRWWRVQPEKWKNVTRNLIANGQLVMINGGWCMHDEATPLAIDMIDQTTLGHRFLLSELGVTPRIGWQIDPFGHSAFNAVSSALFGFDATYFARADYQDKKLRTASQELEFVWRGSPSLPASNVALFTGLFIYSYNPPGSLNYDTQRSDVNTNTAAPPVIDDPLLEEYNVPEVVANVLSLVQPYADASATNNILIPMGADFAYQNAEVWFKNMDRLIKHLNANGSINVLYSNPEIYTQAVHATNHTFSSVSDDFFPYASASDQYWAGYFTSRPGLKGYVRTSSSFLQSARQLERAVGRSSIPTKTTDSLEAAMGVLQHHDAVSGTEREVVADDYARRLALGKRDSIAVASDALASLIGGPAPAPAFTYCHALNVSVCAPTQSLSSSVAIVLYNNDAHSREEYIRIPVDSTSVTITNATGHAVTSQILLATTDADTRAAPGLGGAPAGSSTSSHVLVFKASLPPGGYTTYFLSKTSTPASVSPLTSVSVSEANVTIGNANIQVTIDTATGTLSSFTNSADSLPTTMLNQELAYYTSYGSGAYIFVPEGSPVTVSQVGANVTITKGPLVTEARISYPALSGWLSQVIRVYADATFVESEVTVGPIPINDGGREVVVRYDTSINSQEQFKTDSNGRDMLLRTVNKRVHWPVTITNPVAGNYAPITSQLRINDSTSHLSIIVDRAVGGGSIRNGQVELMIHRRLTQDDNKGLGQALNETQNGCYDCPSTGLVVRSIHRLSVDSPAHGAHASRSLSRAQYHVVEPFFMPISDSPMEWAKGRQLSGSLYGGSIPERLSLMTMQQVPGSTATLVRLAHDYEIGEDASLSLPVTFDLKTLFPTAHSVTAVEQSLSANQPRATMETRRLQFSTNQPGPVVKPSPVLAPGETVFTINPMEIRTFLVEVQ